MSLARAVTKRMKRSEAPASLPNRSRSMKHSGSIDRSQISSPVALISTTNMLSYNAPDIATLRHKASISNLSTADDSDHSVSTARSRSSSNGSRETLTDASSVGSSPTSPTAGPNHLSGFFPPQKLPRRSMSSSNLQHSTSDSVDASAVPAIPERALSHSKRAHERLAQKRSLQHMTTRGSLHSSRGSREHRASVDMFRSPIKEEEHPFGKELEQLNEVAEEFGGVVRDAECEADRIAMLELKLAAFTAADYLTEIQPLFTRRFGSRRIAVPLAAAPMAWI